VPIPQITVLSRCCALGSVSEFLIVGCQHGWLLVIGYDRGDSNKAVIRTASQA
jgi:hypothetical protein